MKDTPFDSVNIAKDTLDEIKAKTLPVIDEEKGALMQKEIERVRDLGDSIGRRSRVRGGRCACGTG